MTTEKGMSKWKKHPTHTAWEMRDGDLRARVKYIRAQAADFMWAVIRCDASLPDFAELEPVEYEELIAGDTVGDADDDAAEEEAKALAASALTELVSARTTSGTTTRLHTLAAVSRERDAYKKAKQENDERFMIERDVARTERDEAWKACRETAEEADRKLKDWRKDYEELRLLKVAAEEEVQRLRYLVMRLAEKHQGHALTCDEYTRTVPLGYVHKGCTCGATTLLAEADAASKGVILGP